MATDCPPFGLFSFKNVVITLDASRVIGFADGDDVISIEPTTEIGDPLIGADGASIVSFSADQSASVTIKLLANSPFNQFLNQKVQRQRGGAVVGVTFPISFLDVSSGESGGCTNAVVTKEATIQSGKKTSEREWRIFCPCWQPGQVDYTR